MTKINLIPPEIRAATTQRQIRTLGMAAGGIVAVGLIGFWTTRYSRLKNITAELTQAQADLAKYQAIVDKVNTLEQTRNQLKARSDVIKSLMKGRLTYPKMLEDFMPLMPGDVWINSFGTAPNSAQPDWMDLTLSAQSLSNFAIADWLTNLQGSPLCADVKLGAISTQESTDGKPPVLSFTMNFRYLRKEP